MTADLPIRYTSNWSQHTRLPDKDLLNTALLQNTVSLSRLLLFCIALMMPGLAVAHSVIPDAGGFVNGLIHPYVLPQQVIMIALLGMFVGQHDADGIKWAVPPFGLALILGLFITSHWFWAPLQFVILVVCIPLGLAVAIARPLPLLWLSLLVACAGMMLGMDSPQQQLFGRERYMAFSGTLVGAFFGMVYIAAMTEMLARPWMKRGIRILGSLGAAIALMVLARAVVYR